MGREAPEIACIILTNTLACVIKRERPLVGSGDIELYLVPGRSPSAYVSIIIKFLGQKLTVLLDSNDTVGQQQDMATVNLYSIYEQSTRQDYTDRPELLKRRDAAVYSVVK